LLLASLGAHLGPEPFGALERAAHPLIGLALRLELLRLAACFRVPPGLVLRIRLELRLAGALRLPGLLDRAHPGHQRATPE
jgi:hypothetical protein